MSSLKLVDLTYEGIFNGVDWISSMRIFTCNVFSIIHYDQTSLKNLLALLAHMVRGKKQYVITKIKLTYNLIALGERSVLKLPKIIKSVVL